MSDLRSALLLSAIVLFVLAAISVWSSLDWQPVGLIAAGLAAWAASSWRP